MTVDEAIQLLNERKRDLLRSKLESLLVEFGFVVRPGTKGNHRKFTHPGLAPFGFYGGDFDGGHGRDAKVLFPYVLDIRKIFVKYRAELRTLLGEQDD